MNKAVRFLRVSFLLLTAAAVAGSAFAQRHRFARPQERTPARSARPSRPSSAPTATRAPASSTLHSASKDIVKTASGEQFYIIASVDQPKSQILVKRPTEVTLLIHVTPKTRILNDQGKPVAMSLLRAGDTIWALTSGSGSELTAIRIREGEMTVADLHRYYLDYPEIK